MAFTWIQYIQCMFKCQQLSDGMNAKELKHMPFILLIRIRVVFVFRRRPLAWHECHVYYMSSGCVCMMAAWAYCTSDRLFCLSPPFILIVACFSVQQWPGRSLLLFPNVNRYVSMRLERSLTKGGIWPDTAQYANYRQPDEVPFHQHLIWENRST